MLAVAGGRDYPKHIFSSYHLSSTEDIRNTWVTAQVTSDNGSNLVSKEIEDFFFSHGIRHRKVTRYWPRANAMVERFNIGLWKKLSALLM